jgi:hypothetical protein
MWIVKYFLLTSFSIKYFIRNKQRKIFSEKMINLKIFYAKQGNVILINSQAKTWLLKSIRLLKFDNLHKV